MNRSASSRLNRLYGLLLVVTMALCQQNIALAQDAAAFSQPELDQMLAPVALYPDALLSQIMMAATYPLEVVEAARWSHANPGLAGERAVNAVERNNWDPSVKSMVAFPQILGMMSDKLDWTERLGDAFLDQESQVMDTVQDLRHRAYAGGNLRSNDNYRVNSSGDYIDIDETDPGFAYVPYYDPGVVYGPWRSPQYPPVYWAPWPGYRERAGFGAGFAWGAGIALGSEFFFGALDWRQHRVDVVNVNNSYYPRNAGSANRSQAAWQHAPEHRRGIPYRAAAVRSRFSGGATAIDSRRDFRGRAAPAAMPAERKDNRADLRAGASDRPDERSAGKAAATATAGSNRGAAAVNARTPAATAPVRPDLRDNRRDARNNTPAVTAAPAKPETRSARPAPTARAAAEPAPHALENIGRGSEARNASERGRASTAPAAPRAPERAAAPTQRQAAPMQRQAAPAPPQHAAAPAQAAHERPRESPGKGRQEK